MKVSRLNSIEQYVISRETVSIDELCEVFGVSKNTIRRDLNELEQRGHITKVYGGVTATVPSGAVPTPIRSGLNQIDKSLIGRLAAEEVADGDTIFIDSGTTTLCLLRFLVAKKRITIITHSLGALSEASTITSILSRSAAFTARLQILLSVCPRSKRCPPCVLTRRSWARPACR
jgi:DeoR family myo-inositol catabolism operon transcriptional repressor